MLRVRRGHRFAHVALWAALCGGCSDDPAPSPTVRIHSSWDFEGFQEGAGAPGFVVATTNPDFGAGDARWAVLPSGAEGGRCLALVRSRNPKGVFNLAWAASVTMEDVDCSVRLKTISGKDARGGGLCCRLQDEKSYYVLVWDERASMARLDAVVGGKPKTLARLVSEQTTPGRWHTLRLRVRGTRLEAWLDEAALGAVQDVSLRGPGKVALWTEADAATQFDDLVARSP